jgi:hypothetical protein
VSRWPAWLVLSTVTAAACLQPACSRHRSIEAGFWFEPVTYNSSRIGHPLTRSEIDAIAAGARAEITKAFAGLPLTLSERRDARYRVRVMQDVRDPRFRSDVAVAGESESVGGFSGVGSVNFRLLASYADTFAPPGADRQEIVAAIGRGVGRAAVHEFAHQLLGRRADIHATRDVHSYEYDSAARREQYYGDMHWDVAWPMLQSRFGLLVSDSHR